MPPQATWHYNWQAELGSQEAELSEKYLIANDGLAECRRNNFFGSLAWFYSMVKL